MAGQESDVLIVGAGPVGMTLALDLAARGVTVTLCETRPDANPPSVKCNHVSARSMEIYRRLGLAGAIRDAGLPPDYPHSVSYRTATTGREITRIPLAARQDRFTDRDTGADAGWPTPEPPHRINQIYMEPILGEAAAAHPHIDLRFRCEVTGFTQDEDSVTATLRDLGTGAETPARARFLVGCDGGRSATRKAIGATLEGDAVIQRVQSSYIRAPGLIEAMQAPPAWAMFSMNPRRTGNVYAIDGRQTWLVHNYLRPDEEGFDSVDRDACLREILGVGPEFAYELLSREDWYGRRLVTDRMRDRRVFICGDAAHLWVPYAGYGMNAGIADAANLAWMLAGHLAGWAPAAILDAHEAERLPITRQVSHFAMDHCMKMAGQRSAVPEDIEADTPAAAARREAFAREVYDLNVMQYAAAGLNFGYYYDASPIIAYDGDAAPGYGMGEFTSSTVPGCRVPHLWLSGGRSLYDEMGEGFALLRLDPATGTAPLERGAADAGLPLKVVEVDGDDPLRAVYTTRLLIARPDQHVGWRGDAAPADPGALIDRLRGAG